MANTRNAGRKSLLSTEQMEDVKSRVKNGESVGALAKEYGISRQALYKKLRDQRLPSEFQMDYLIDGRLCTRIMIDRRSQALRIENYAEAISQRAFGTLQKPTSGDLQAFLDNYFLEANSVNTFNEFFLTDETGKIDIFKNVPKRRQDGKCVVIRNDAMIPRFYFSKTDRVLRRTDTDGFQMKAITSDRRYFVKSQAVIAGVRLRDWAVEMIASDLCQQLSIACVKQRHAGFVYEGKTYDGVYSENFELDGYTFISFDRLLSRHGWSTMEEEFISLDAIGKLTWCAEKLAEAGTLNHADTEKYMLDLAVIDCLVGNTDRHDKNYGLFYNVNTQRFEIPLIFDNGMGLFENDPCRDEYHTFDEAMHNIYVAPYGEDPFDLLALLDEAFDLRKIYPGITNLHYPDVLHTPFALEYERRIQDFWRK